MVDSAAITYSNLHTQSFWNIYNLLNNRTKIIDPADAMGRRKFIFVDNEPDVTARGFEGYPIIIMSLPTVGHGDRKVLSSTKQEINGEVEIEIQTSPRITNDGSTTILSALTDMNNICDDLFETFSNKTNKQSLRDNGLKDVMVEFVDSDTIDKEGRKVFTRNYRLTFNNALLTVSV